MLGWPCRIDFSRAEALLIASSGRATSMSFLLVSRASISVGVVQVLVAERGSAKSIVHARHAEVRAPRRWNGLAQVVDAVASSPSRNSTIARMKSSGLLSE